MTMWNAEIQILLDVTNISLSDLIYCKLGRHP